eukprot:TRINITY_DN500_c0_g1_i1.p2 TRINITY_DN500_c0_g1~~TRINITY_DN500_c0_g1_i1.p2  ORF type:complete len:80 (-),score=8.56 TRINITY_DN500_c0_g1_i1:86-325(-)
MTFARKFSNFVQAAIPVSCVIASATLTWKGIQKSKEPRKPTRPWNDEERETAERIKQAMAKKRQQIRAEKAQAQVQTNM